jgi:pilus assembly protein CpaE
MMIAHRALHVAGAVRSPQLQYELTEAIAACDDVELDLRIGDLKSLASVLLRSDRMPNVLLLEVDVNDAEDMDVLQQLSAEASRTHVPIVVTAGDPGPAMARRLLRLGVADLIAQPIERADVPEVLRNADHKARRRQQRGPSKGRVLTFSRATGGAGATTLAVNVAHALALAHRGSGARVCLIDLDLQFGTVALQLDLHPTGSLFDVAQARKGIDPALLARSLVKHRSGLQVLAAPNARLSLETLRPAVVNALLELARAEFDYVVVDLPIALTGWTETVLSHSDLVYLVTQCNLPAIWQLRRLLDIIEAVGLHDVPVQLVLNRLQGAFGWSVGATRRQAEKALGRPFDYCIAEQLSVLTEAANRGAPVLDVRRYSRFGRQLRAMLKQSLRELATRPALASIVAS